MVTGMSGAGKSQTMNALEDMGYYCIDNIPPVLVTKIYELCAQSENLMQRAAIVVDSRAGDSFSGLKRELLALKEGGHPIKVLFLDCEDSVLVRRYKETRRKHPLLKETGNLPAAVKLDRKIVSPMKATADYVIDTSILSTAQLKRRVNDLFSENNMGLFQIQTMSFGFKYGIPAEADLIFDVRFLPNPFYVEELKHKTGLEEDVRDYVYQDGSAQEFMNKLGDLLLFCAPKYQKEGKSQLVVGIGCTGGKHRSVAIADAVNQLFSNAGYRAMVLHRDIWTDR